MPDRNMSDVLDEIARQMAIANRMALAREYLKIGFYNEDDYIDALRDIEDDLR